MQFRLIAFLLASTSYQTLALPLTAQQDHSVTRHLPIEAALDVTLACARSCLAAFGENSGSVECLDECVQQNTPPDGEARLGRLVKRGFGTPEDGCTRLCQTSERCPPGCPQWVENLVDDSSDDALRFRHRRIRRGNTGLGMMLLTDDTASVDDWRKGDIVDVEICSDDDPACDRDGWRDGDIIEIDPNVQEETIEV